MDVAELIKRLRFQSRLRPRDATSELCAAAADAIEGQTMEQIDPRLIVATLATVRDAMAGLLETQTKIVRVVTALSDHVIELDRITRHQAGLPEKPDALAGILADLDALR